MATGFSISPEKSDRTFSVEQQKNKIEEISEIAKGDKLKKRGNKLGCAYNTMMPQAYEACKLISGGLSQSPDFFADFF